jgi:hypothetical protein
VVSMAVTLGHAPVRGPGPVCEPAVNFGTSRRGSAMAGPELDPNGNSVRTRFASEVLGRRRAHRPSGYGSPSGTNR